MGVKDVQIIVTGKDQTGGLFSKLRQESMLTQSAVKSLGGSFGGLKSILSSSAAVAGGIAGYEGAVLGISKTLGSAFEFAKNLEVSATGMSGILMSMGQINGKNIEWNDALGISQQIITKMNNEALRTAATSEELIRATQALLAPGLGAGMTIDQITTLTVTGVNAVKSIGLQSYQVVQELRDLVAGGIQPASSTLATALGLKDADIKAAKASSQGLFTFLMERLRGFEVASGEYSKTWQGITDQLKEGVTRAGASGMEPLFSAVKSEMSGLVSQIVQVDNETKKISINPNLVAGIRSAAETAVAFGGEMKSLAGTVWNIAQPIGSVLVPSLQLAATHAKELTIAIAGWMILKQVSVIYTDISLAMAGAATAQTFLGKAVIETNMKLAQQAAAATIAGAAVRDAALLSSVGQKGLSSAVLLTNMSLLNGGTAAVAAGTRTVGAMAVAGTAVRGLLTGVWALVGGWFGVAAAVGYAIYKLWEYKDEKSKIGYYEEGNTEGTTGGRGRSGRPRFIKYADSGMGGLQAQDRLSDSELQALKEQQLKEKMDAVVGKFSGTDTGKGAEKAYEEEQRLRDKIADMVAKMNAKIREDTETTYESNTAKLADEIENTKRDLDKSKIDFAKYGIDVSSVYTKIEEYQANQTAKFAKEQAQALQSVKNDTMANNAAITTDYTLAAEAQYQATLLSIKKQVEERKKSSGNTTAVVDWEVSAIKKAEQEKVQAVADGESKKHAMRLQFLDFEYQQGNLSSANYRAAYLADVDAYIASNQKKLASLTQYSDAWKNNVDQTASALTQKYKLMGENVNTAWQEAMRRMNTDAYDYSGRITSTFDEMGNSMSTALYETISGTGDGLKNVFGNICNSVLKMWADMLTQMYIMAPMKNWFSSLLGGSGGTSKWATSASTWTTSALVPHAAGGGYQVGPGTSTSDSILSWLSNGEYVINAAAVQKYGVGMFDALNQKRIPAFASGGSVSGYTPSAGRTSGNSSGVAPNVQVNVVNQTGTQAKARQQSSFDSETNTLILSVFLEAVENNTMGFRDTLGAL